jgi:hypothetical protein
MPTCWPNDSPRWCAWTSTPSWRERILAIRPAAISVEIDAPHLLLQTRPTQVWRHLAPFLEDRAQS